MLFNGGMDEVGKDEPQITRRKFLGKALLSGLTVATAGIGYKVATTGVSAGQEQVAERVLKAEPVVILNGKVYIDPAVNFRTEPNIEAKGDAPNILGRRQEDQGKQLVAQNPLLVDGGPYQGVSGTELWFQGVYGDKIVYFAADLDPQVRKEGERKTISKITTNLDSYFADEKGRLQVGRITQASSDLVKK